MRRILIAVAVVGLLAAALWVLKRRENDTVAQERGESRLLQYDDRAVTGFTLVTSGKAWSFKVTDDGWKLVAPVADAVDTTEIQELLRVTRRTPVTRVIEDPEPLATYGLDPPAASIRIEGAQVPVLDLGDATPTGDGLFARVEGRPGVLVLDLRLGKPLLHPDPNRLRDSTLTGMVRADLREIEIESEGARLRVVREDEAWWITAPRRLPASEAGVDRLMEGLENAAVRRTVDDAGAQDPAFGLGSGSVKITLRGAARTRSLTLGAPAADGLRFALRDDRKTVLLVDAAPLAALPLDAGALADTRLTRVNRYQVTRFTYEAGAGRLVAVREGKDRWETESGESLPADAIYELLVQLLDAPVSGYETRGRPGQEPAATLEFVVEGGRKDRIEFYPGRKARVVSLSDVVYRLDSPPPPVPVLP